MIRIFWQQAPFLISGILFGVGLTAAGMTSPEVVLSFLNFEDFGLLLVLGCATTLSLVVYQLAPRFMNTPLLARAFAFRPSEGLKRTLLGALLFGIGWGLCGVCPGPAIAALGSGNWPVLVTLLAMFAGAYVQGRWFS
ncbi:MAG: YeeE/YedE family protein [Candidatus Pelagadaptatus aseana]|uniref:DUF6691 family protein n=1 Tax=Candidatus Pelagadaptatus aseana TaxID=3120508 RepID=UPI0039B1E388